MRLVQIMPRQWRVVANEVGKLGTIGLGNVSRVLPRRLRGISHELAKFGTIGLINLIVNFAVFNLLWLTFLRDGEVKAKAVATIVATTCAYFMNRHWTYRDRPKSTLRREYSLFVFFNAVGLVIEVAVVGIAKYGFDQTHIVVLNLLTGVGIVLGTIFRFWAYRTHVFKAGIDPETDAEPVPAAAAAADFAPAALTGVASLSTTPIPAASLAAASLSAASEGVDVLALVDSTRADTDTKLQDELTQIELDTIVAREQAASRTRT